MLQNDVTAVKNDFKILEDSATGKLVAKPKKIRFISLCFLHTWAKLGRLYQSLLTKSFILFEHLMYVQFTSCIQLSMAELSYKNS